MNIGVRLLRVRERRLDVLDELRGDADEIAGRRAGDDAVEVVREALGFHQRLAPAVRASEEVRTRFGRAVMAAEDRLGDFGGAMDREVAEVQLPLQVVERPGRVGDAAALVTGIGADGGVAVRSRTAAPGCAIEPT